MIIITFLIVAAGGGHGGGGGCGGVVVVDNVVVGLRLSLFYRTIYLLQYCVIVITIYFVIQRTSQRGSLNLAYTFLMLVDIYFLSIFVGDPLSKTYALFQTSLPSLL